MDIERKVREIVKDKLGTGDRPLTNELNFIEDLNADSLDTVELVMAFEEEFGIEIPDNDQEKIKTIGQAIEYITGHSA